MADDRLFFHVAILVKDIDAAIQDFSRSLGLTFHPPIRAEFSQLVDPEPHASFCRCTYSQDGPPHIELIEANGDGLFSLSQGEGVHHLGFWEDDMEGRCSMLAALAVNEGARTVGVDGVTYSWFNRPEDCHGVRLEYLNTAQREVAETWMKTGYLGPTNL
jgi:catechol 2,3-dioxygenase-like lactoylglutathione lyase family enzyme